MDFAHWPTRRSHGAGSGLLEGIPLCRFHHRLLDDYVAPWPSIIGKLAFYYHQRMFALFHDDVLCFLGSDERVEEVKLGK